MNWKQLYALCLIALGLSIPCALRAQQFDPAHRHAIEITTGPAPLRELVRSASSLNGQLGRDLYMKGQRGSQECHPSINIAYTCALNERWDLHLTVNFSTTFYTVKQYAIVEDGGPNPPAYPVIDEAAGPINSLRANTGLSWAVMVDARWKWLRRDAFTLYSALGVGVSFGQPKYLSPYISPIGIRVGRKHVYGLAELNISSAATFALAGIGYRF